MKAKALTKVIRVDRNGPMSEPKLSRKRKDKVKWRNIDQVKIRIKFDKWPFTGKKKIIPVPAGKLSASLTLSSKAENDKYGYSLLLPKGVKASRTPGPDPPGVSAGD